MVRYKCIIVTILVFLGIFAFQAAQSQEGSGIDRMALVKRHNVNVGKFDTLTSLSVGNGEFAFTVDATGLQTFPEYYDRGIPLGTQSQWGWHSFPDTNGYKPEEALKEYNFHGRKIPYAVQVKEPARAKDAVNYLRENPHRLHLGIVGLELLKPDGSKVSMKDISNIRQEQELWEGKIHSTFDVMGSRVEVVTYCHPDKDLIAVEVRSILIRKGLLKVNFRFPYPTGGHVDSGCDWQKPGKHQSVLSGLPNSVIIQRKIDNTGYYVKVDWPGQGSVCEVARHYFVLSPGTDQDKFSFTCLFNQEHSIKKLPNFAETEASSQVAWGKFWMQGGAIDFSGSTDPRANELERRVVLSQYLTKIQCAGSVPPQETGLTCNSWYGKFHLEMHWWHAAHFALWNRTDLLEKSLGWYKEIMPKALEIARREGFEGIRWPKMTDPSGNESPSSIGAMLIWQQPHIIYFAELCYRQHNDYATLAKYYDMVFQSAGFMASYAWYEKEKDRYILGPALIPAQECFDANTTINPPFELEYWYWGLSTAQKWLERLHRPRNEKWDQVLARLSVLAQQKGIYLVAESAPDSYTTPRYTTDHPAVLGAYGLLPGSRLVDSTTMRNTFDYIWKNWKWEDTWGWDFPLTAMSATRLGLPDRAIDALFMPSKKNTYLANGHNFQDSRLRLYLPGNGGLLAAVAMMCAGYDGCKTDTPGIPKNGRWKVKWEGLNKMP
jgi:protein-glucosylgalactosylhydroxylysine glucosidase